MEQRREDIRRQTGRAALLLVVVTLSGALGYYLIEQRANWTFLDALYMAVITIATVGFQEVHPLDPVGRLFTIGFVLFGVGAFTYLATSVANYIITGEMRGYWSQRRMEKKIAALTQHFIVCAYGRMGSQVADEFQREGRAVVVIDPREEALRRAREAGFLTVAGDAGNDDVLRQSGVERAYGLVACLDQDAGNLMVVLSARALNEKLFIVARTNHHETTSKLVAAGANRVLWPYGLGGRRMAQMALRPNVVEFLEIVMHDQELELLLEEVPIALGSPLAEQAIGAADVRGKTGTMLVAVRQLTGKMHVAPASDTVLSAGDIAVALGTRDQLRRLRALATGAGPGERPS